MISQSTNDTRELITDNYALLAEIEAVNNSLKEERQATQELIYNINKYTEASEEEKTLLKENNKILLDQIKILEKKNKQANIDGWIKLIFGVAIGVIATN